MFAYLKKVVSTSLAALPLRWLHHVSCPGIRIFVPFASERGMGPVRVVYLHYKLVEQKREKRKTHQGLETQTRLESPYSAPVSLPPPCVSVPNLAVT